VTKLDKANEDIEIGSGSTFVPVEPFEIIVFGGTGDLARRFTIAIVTVKFQMIAAL